MVDQEKEPEKKESQNTSQKSFSEKHLTAGFWWLMLLAGMYYIYKISIGFTSDSIALLVLVVLFFSVLWSVGWELAAGLLILDFVLPLFLLYYGLFPAFTYFLTHLPIWAIGLGIYEAVKEPNSTFSKLSYVAVGLIAVFFLWPSITQAQLVSNYNTIAFNQFEGIKDTVFDAASNSYQSIKTSGQLALCNINPDPKGCSDKIVTPEQQLAQQLKAEVSETTAGLSLSINDFVPTGILGEDTTAITLSAKNNLNSPVKLLFSCGLEKKGAGKPDPAERILNVGQLSDQENTVLCTELNVSKRASTRFYFNVTATDALSSGQRDIIVLDDNVKKATLSSTSGVSEDEKMLNSQWGDIIKLNLDTLKAQVGGEDLIQPIIKVAGVAGINAKSPLVYGVSEGTEIPFGLFIVNNGNGKILNVDKITFTLPSIFEFNPVDCGITQDLLKKTNWRSYAKDSYFSRICKIKVKSQKQYPNNIDILTIGVNVQYDYSVTRAKDVTIPGQVSS